MLRPPVARRVVGDTFVGQNIAVIIDAEAAGAGANGDVVAGGEVGFHGGKPSLDRLTLDLGFVHRGATAKGRGLLQEDHATPGVGSGFRGQKACDACAHDKDIAEGTKAGVTGTPSFVVGRVDKGRLVGLRLVGAMPYAQIEAKIREVMDKPAP